MTSTGNAAGGSPERRVQTAIEAVAQRFTEAGLHYGHGTDSAWDEAVYLVLSVAQLSDDVSTLSKTLVPGAWQQINRIATQRIEERVPLAYLLGRCRYAGLEFRIEPGVLVPRSPLGPWLLEHAESWLPAAPGRILDLCTGSGALGILVAHLYPDAELVLTDIDPQALQLAAANVAEHGLSSRTRLLRGDGASPVLAEGATFDLVLCNPPYVNAQDMATLPPEYQREPALALAAGEDGLAVMSPILMQCARLLAADGVFLGEVGLSDVALQAAHPDLPFIWLSFEEGGEGVFALLAEQLGHSA